MLISSCSCTGELPSEALRLTHQLAGADAALVQLQMLPSCSVQDQLARGIQPEARCSRRSRCPRRSSRRRFATHWRR